MGEREMQNCPAGVGQQVWESMMEVCRRWTGKAPEGVVIAEPYVPYIPMNCNGIIVLAESQNLSPDTDRYVRKLRDESTQEDKILRLYKPISQRSSGARPKMQGVQPWDDGSIPLALKAINPQIDIHEVAVSNAVPWSKSDGRKNINPDKDMKKEAALFWKDLLDAWKQDVCFYAIFGRVAEAVMSRSVRLTEHNHVRFRLPSPNLQISASLFDREDLLKRFCEVRKALQSPEIAVYGKDVHSIRPVFFACHAVSKTRGHWVSRSAEW